MKRFPLAWFVTFHPYGLWLPGDRRGWTDPRMMRRGVIRMPPQPALEAHARSLMRELPLLLDATMVRVVRAAVIELASYRGWRLDALTVQRDHLHVVCGASLPGTTVRGALKAYGTRRLREAGLVAPDRTVWAVGGSVRCVFTSASLGRVVKYVLNHERTKITRSGD